MEERVGFFSMKERKKDGGWRVIEGRILEREDGYSRKERKNERKMEEWIIGR
jgi:hypothetical protein